MIIFTALHELQAYLKKRRSEDKTIGLVPTMGALHAGHGSLIQLACQQNDVTVCSIYVNPTQFNNANDLKNYPRTLDADTQLLEELGCEVVFAPDNDIMYADSPKIKFDFGNLELVMEGRYRPGHFNGVGIVVSKLFHMIRPDRAYFGQKDLQQYLIIRQLVKDLNFGIEIIGCPIIREVDGLAMSSRNTRLNSEQRQISTILYQSLLQAKEMVYTHHIPEIKQSIRQIFKDIQEVELEYFEIVDGNDLSIVEDIHVHSHVALCIAAYLGDVRLIDNLLLFS